MDLFIFITALIVWCLVCFCIVFFLLMDNKKDSEARARRNGDLARLSGLQAMLDDAILDGDQKSADKIQAVLVEEVARILNRKAVF